MRRNIKRLVSTPFAILLAMVGMAQYSLADAEHYSLKYPDANVVLLKGSQTYTIVNGKDGLEISLKTSEDNLVSKAASYGQQAEEVYSDSTYMQLASIEAYSLVPEKGKYKKHEVKEFYVKDDMEGISFTSDSKSHQFYFPKVSNGVIKHLDYTTQVKSPYFLPSLFTQSFYPYDSYEVKVIVDNDVDLDISFYYLDEDDYAYQKIVSKKSTEHVWTFKEVEALDYYANAPSGKWYIPHIMVRIEGYQATDGYRRVLKDVQDLYTHYQNWIDKIAPEDPEKLRPLVDELIDGATSDVEKLERIFHWVQDNVKYISFTDGVRGTVPESAQEVFSCRFGDCKGMSNLMYNMSDLAGVKTYRTWIGSRDIPYSYDDVISPLVDNHMILSYMNADTVLFLDATDSDIPFGTPTRFIQDKQALIGLSRDQFALRQVPIMHESVNQTLDSVRLSIEGSDLKGQGTMVMTGYNAVMIQSALYGQDDGGVKKVMAQLLRKGDDRFVLDNYKLNFSDEKDKATIDYSFTVPRYVLSFEDEVYVNLNLDPVFGMSAIEKERSVPVDLNYSSSSHYIIQLDIPSAMTVEVLPENENFQEESFGYSIGLSQNDDGLRMDYSTYTNELIMWPDKFDSWNELSKQFRKSIAKNVVLIKEQ